MESTEKIPTELFPARADSQRIFEQMIEQRDINWRSTDSWVRNLRPVKFGMLLKIDYSAYLVGIGLRMSVLLQGK